MGAAYATIAANLNAAEAAVAPPTPATPSASHVGRPPRRAARAGFTVVLADMVGLPTGLRHSVIPAQTGTRGSLCSHARLVLAEHLSEHARAAVSSFELTHMQTHACARMLVHPLSPPNRPGWGDA